MAGRPKFDVEKDVLIMMYKEYGNWDNVALVLGCARSTLFRRLDEYGLTRRGLFDSKYGN